MVKNDTPFLQTVQPSLANLTPTYLISAWPVWAIELISVEPRARPLGNLLRWFAFCLEFLRNLKQPFFWYIKLRKSRLNFPASTKPSITVSSFFLRSARPKIFSYRNKSIADAFVRITAAEALGSSCFASKKHTLPAVLASLSHTHIRARAIDW